VETKIDPPEIQCS